MNIKCSNVHSKHLVVIRNRPLASLISVILSCVAGSILTNLLLGIPVAAAFKSETFLLMIIAVWAGVFYCPQVFIWIRVCLFSDHYLCRTSCSGW